MSRASLILLFVCFVCVTEFASGYLIRVAKFDTFLTMDVPILQNFINGNELSLEQEAPAPEITLNKKCAEIGEFCMNNKDCCSNLCLGYMKRCVSS